MAAGKIVDLRKLLAERFPQEPLPAATRLATGLPGFEQALAGGLAKGAITELSGTSPQAGSATLFAALLERARRERYFIALIDGRDSFDPAAVSGAALRHLLWVRCQQASEALQAADLLLRDGNFPLVVLDLVLNPALELRRIPQNNWYRLQRLVEPAPTAFVVFTAQPMISSAQWKLALENRWALPQLEEPAADLVAGLRFRARRLQPNESRDDGALSQAG